MYKGYAAYQKRTDRQIPLVLVEPAVATGQEERELGDDLSRRLLDIEEIKNLKARYFRLLDAKQWSEWTDVFTDDLEFVYVDPSVQNVPSTATILPDGKAKVDRDQLVGFVSEAMARVTTIHHGHVPEIRLLDENTALGHWGLTNYCEYRAATIHAPGCAATGTTTTCTSAPDPGGASDDPSSTAATWSTGTRRCVGSGHPPRRGRR